MYNLYIASYNKEHMSPTGWAYAIPPNPESNKLITAACGIPNTTRLRGELTALVNGLLYLYEEKVKTEIVVHTDLPHVLRALTEGWLDLWIDNNFRGIKNQDLWLKVYKLIYKLNCTFYSKQEEPSPYSTTAERLAKEASLFTGEPEIYNLNL